MKPVAKFVPAKGFTEKELWEAISATEEFAKHKFLTPKGWRAHFLGDAFKKEDHLKCVEIQELPEPVKKEAEET